MPSRPTFAALARVIEAMSERDGQAVVRDMLRGPFVSAQPRRRRTHGPACAWILQASSLDALRRGFKRIAHHRSEVGRDKASAWLIYASICAQIATVDELDQLAKVMQVTKPRVGGRSLDNHHHDRPPGERRGARRDHVVRWLLDRVPVRRHRAVSAALTEYFDSVDGARLAAPTAPSPPPRRRSTSQRARRARAYVERKVRLHDKTQMRFQRARIDATNHLIDREIEAGNHALVADMICDLLPVNFVLERLAARDRQTQALAEAVHDHQVPEPIKLQALIEGLGTNLGWRRADNPHIGSILDPSTGDRLERALRQPQGERSAKMHATLQRRARLALAVRERVRASRDQVTRSVSGILNIYRAADAAAQRAHHESLSMSIRIDAARFLRARQRSDQALSLLNTVIAAAQRQGNHRRRAMALMQRADLFADAGWSVAAWQDWREANSHFEWLQLDRRGNAVETDWYQPSMRPALDALEASITERVGPAPKENAAWPAIVTKITKKK